MTTPQLRDIFPIYPRVHFSALGVLVVLLLIYTIASPRAFLNPLICKAAFAALPQSIVLTIPLVLVIASGEIDLSFGSVMGLAGWAFAATIEAGGSPWLALVVALGAGGRLSRFARLRG